MNPAHPAAKETYATLDLQNVIALWTVPFELISTYASLAVPVLSLSGAPKVQNNLFSHWTSRAWVQTSEKSKKNL